MMTETVFFEMQPQESEILLGLYGDVDYDTVRETLNADNVGLYGNAKIVSTFIYSDLGADVLAQMPQLGLIATRSRTFDHIDLDYCRAHMIAVMNVPAYGENTVAEHVFALLLSLTRHMPQAIRQTKEGEFSLQGLRGDDLRGKTMGVIGTGAIGLHTAAIAKGFGMTVLANDLQPKMDMGVKLGFSYTGLDDLLKKSDVISLHVADTPAAERLLAEREFSLMKDGVIVINTACSRAIDGKALLQALATGKVGAAGLDVLPDEPTIREEAILLHESSLRHHDPETMLAAHALLRHKNVIVTPHCAFYTKGTVTDILRKTGENIQSYLESHPSAATFGGQPAPLSAVK